MFPDGIKIRWLGNAFFEVVSPEGHRIALDPFFQSNPAFPKKSLEEVTNRGAYKVIAVTHPHNDHFEGVIPLLKNDSQLKVICQYEVGCYLTSKGIKDEQILGMNTGGTRGIEDFRITMVPAVHTSSVLDGQTPVALGVAVGYVIRFSNGFTIYYTGDTCVTMDMQIVSDIYRPDVVILPIGDFYTMGPEQAAYALKLLRPKFAIPGHYRSADGFLPGTPAELSREMARYHLETRILDPQPGDWL